MGWKYIVLELSGDLVKIGFPIIFPDKLIHKEVADLMRLALPRSGPVQVVSAGKIEHLSLEGLGGDSETLKLGSHPDDKKLIETYSYLHGIRS